MNIRIKKLWLGKYVSLRDNWIRDGIKKGGLDISYLEKSMFLNVKQLESVLLSTPSQIISSKYKGKYKLYDVEFGKKDSRQQSWFNKKDDFYEVCSYANMQPNNVFEIKEQAKKYFKDSSEERSTLLSALLDRLLQRYY